MTSEKIYSEVQKLLHKFGTREPFELLENMGIITEFSDNYRENGLKGYCLSINRSSYVVINNKLNDMEKRIVAAHELGHIVLHGQLLKLAPMEDFALYSMKIKTEYEANLFASDILISDNEVAELAKNEDLDYFSMCKCLGVSSEFLSFKLYSLISRGFNYKMPQNINSGFLKS